MASEDVKLEENLSEKKIIIKDEETERLTEDENEDEDEVKEDESKKDISHHHHNETVNTSKHEKDSGLESNTEKATEDINDEKNTEKDKKSIDEENKEDCHDIDFVEIPKEPVNKVKKFSKAIDYLCVIEQPASICEDVKCYEAFFYLKYMLSDDEKFIERTRNWKFLSKNNFEQILVNMLNHLAADSENFDISNCKIAEKTLNPEADVNERKVSMLDYIIIIINKLADIQLRNEYLFEFNKKLFDNKVLEALLAFYKCEAYLKKFSDHYDPDDKMIGIIATIRNISENPFYERQEWKNSKAEETLKEFKSEFPEMYNPLLEEVVANINQRNLDEFLAYLNELDDPAKIFDDFSVYKDIVNMKYYIKNPIFKKYEEFVTHNSVVLFEKMFKHFYEISKDMDFESLLIEVGSQTDKNNLNQRRFTIFYNLLIILNEVIFRSIEINIYFGKLGLVKAIASYLNEDFIKKIANKKNIILLLIKNLSIMSRWADDHKKEWNDLNLVEIFLNIIKMFKDKDESDNQEIIISSYYTIGNIADDKQIEALPEITFVIEKLLNELVQIADYFEHNKFLEKVKLQFMNGDKKIDYLKVSYLNRAITGTLYGLTRFAVNEKTKNIIFDKFKSLKAIVFKGNTIEKTCALRLLAQLCFNEDIGHDVLADVKLCKYLQEIVDNHKNKDLKKVAQIILWSLNQHKLKHKHHTNRNVFISYNSSTKGICLKVKEGLEKNGFKVIMDLKNPDSSSIDSSTRSIEKSKCVLICVCEKYRVSEKCQAEAQYAFNLKKHIIPLIMQDGYEQVDGCWLSNLINKLLIINFIKYPFDECFTRLIDEINMPSMSLSQNIEDWNSIHVLKWFLDNSIHPSISQVYQNIDGFTLKQIYLMKTQTPEFFYQSLTKETNNTIKTTDIAYFSGKLEILFRNKVQSN